MAKGKLGDLKDDTREGFSKRLRKDLNGVAGKSLVRRGTWGFLNMG